MDRITAKQNSYLYVLLNRLHIDKETKAEMVHNFTGGRVQSTTGLTKDEARQLIDHLAKISPEKPSADRDTKRKKVISYGHKLLWVDSKGKIDMGRLNGWCVKYGQYHKELNAHSHTELDGLISQIKNVYLSTLKAA